MAGKANAATTPHLFDAAPLDQSNALGHLTSTAPLGRAGGPRSTVPPIDLLLSDEAHPEKRWIRTLGAVRLLADELRRQKIHIVLTNGSFDILHVGHSMYVAEARSLGRDQDGDSFLIVGVDSDKKVHQRKGKYPLVPEVERLQMLAHQRGVGAVVLKKPHHAQWSLIDYVRPDLLVVTAGSYREGDLNEIKRKFRCQVRTLPRMATVSSTARLRDAQIALIKPTLPAFEP